MPNTIREIGKPSWAQPEPTEDPTTFRVKHPSDAPIYKEIDELNKEHKIHPLPFPAPRGGDVEPRLTLQEVLGDDASAVKKIANEKQIVFHAGGDCGSTSGPTTQNRATDKLGRDAQQRTDKAPPRSCPL